MYRNISIIVLVLFAVVLGLSESQGEGSEIDYLQCYLAVKTGGDIFCQLYGYNKSNGLTFKRCKLGCGSQNLKLPSEACPSGRMNKCDEKRERITQKMERRDEQEEKFDLWMIGAVVNKGSNFCLRRLR
uniref:Putative secreted protein n=1 Tax=Ixodes ricinus TaxID=34613 RepID=V5GMG2_IXORI